MFFFHCSKKQLFNVKILGLLRREIDEVEMSQYFGLDYDSDEEWEGGDDDKEYSSADESTSGHAVTYNIEKMFEIIQKRDFNEWSLPNIHHNYRQIKEGDAGRKQIQR